MVQKAILEFVKNEDKTSKNGKSYVACSLKVNGEFLNGFGNKVTKTWQAGDEVMIDIFEEEYQGKIYKKFKAVDETDLLKLRVEALEKRVTMLERGEKPKRVVEEVTPDDLSGLPF